LIVGSQNPKGGQPLPSTLIKCGGSLLSLPDIEQRLLTLCERPEVLSPLIVVGGGRVADIIRHWDQLHGLTDEAAHRLAIDGMTLAARMLVATNSRFRLIEHPGECLALPPDSLPILDVAAAVRQLEQTCVALPASWDVTSDSLAAWFATQWDFDNLLLLKSIDLPPVQAGNVAESLVKSDAVDPEFPAAAKRIHKLSWCNLRDDAPLIHRLW